MMDKTQWPTVKFGDVVRLNKERVADPAAEGIERYVGLEHLKPNDLRIRSWGLVEDGTTFTNYFRPGQVLFGKRRAYQRKVAVADFDGVCSGDIYVFEPKDPAVLLPELLPFICQTDSFFEHAVGTSAGSLSPRTNWTQLAWYEFALPPLEEQRRISSLLCTIEDVIETTRDLEKKAEQLRKSFIVERFSQILNDEKTKMVKVAEAGDALMGRQRSPKYDRGVSPRPYLRVANVYDGYIDTSDVKEMDFSDEEFEQYSLKAGDVLLVEGHSSAEVVGRSAIYREEVPGSCFQNTLLRFRPTSVSSEYAHQYFRYCLYSGRFTVVAKQTTIAHLGANRFSAMKFPIPAPELETEIVSDLKSIEDNLQSVARRKHVINQLKRSILDTELTSGTGVFQ